jgi:hypothetical protein
MVLIALVTGSPSTLDLNLLGLSQIQKQEAKHLASTIKNNKRENRPSRFLFGVFSMDSPKERLRRQMLRETYLSYYKLHLGNHSRKDTICSLSELMENEEFINDRSKCQFVYTFVIGAGAPGSRPGRCFWGNLTCAGTSPSHMTLTHPEESVFSVASEYSQYSDVTLLNVRENVNDGKTETWFSYISALLSLERADLGVDFVGKLDSDAVIGVELLLRHYQRDAQRFKNDTNPYLFGGGEMIDAESCTERWGICGAASFIAPVFFGGGMMIISSLLARHAYLDGTDMERMEFSTKEWLPEDLLTANFAYRDPNITVRLIPLEEEELPLIFAHPRKEPADFVKEYWQNCGLNMSDVGKWNQTLSIWSP